jgi:hypothetical protein
MLGSAAVPALSEVAAPIQGCARSMTAVLFSVLFCLSLSARIISVDLVTRPWTPCPPLVPVLPVGGRSSRARIEIARNRRNSSLVCELLRWYGQYSTKGEQR